MKKSIDSILQSFSMGQINDAIVIIKEIGDNGYGVGSLERYMAGLVQETKDLVRTTQMEDDSYVAELISKSPKCPDCGSVLSLFEVNTSPRNMVGGGIGSIWQCPDMDCGYELDSALGYKAELMKLGVKRSTATLGQTPAAVESTRRRIRARANVSRAQRAQAEKPCGGRK